LIHENGGFNVNKNVYKIGLLFILAFMVLQPVSAYEPISGYFEPGGMYGGHSGYHQWVNYCPNCHHYGCLSTTMKPCAEGQISCTRCDSDYDGCTGIDKWGGPYIRSQLTLYVEPEPVVTAQPVQIEQPTTTTITGNFLGERKITLKTEQHLILQKAVI
jgi:hypothetical protein